MQTFCKEHDSSVADFMHIYFVCHRPDADLMQIVHYRILACSMHTLRRANQCHSNAAALPRGGACSDAPPLRPGRQSGGQGRRSGKAGVAKRRPWNAKQGPACGDGGAACVSDTIISFDTAHPPRLVMSTGRAWTGIGRN